MSNSLEQITKFYINTDLSGEEIYQLTGKSPIIYSNLKNYKTLSELLGNEKFCVILYQTSSKTTGHWVAIMYNVSNEIVYFDSYGLHYDTEQQNGATFDVKYPMYLTNLIKNDGRNVVFNQFDYQQWNKNVSTCGRWASVAVKFLRNISLSQFYQIFTTNQNSQLNKPDFAVSLLTLLSLNDITKFFNK